MLHENVRRLTALADFLKPPLDDLAPDLRQLGSLAGQPKYLLRAVQEIAERALRRLCEDAGVELPGGQALENLAEAAAPRAGAAARGVLPESMARAARTLVRHTSAAPPGRQGHDLDAEIALIALLSLLRWSGSAESDPAELAARLLTRLRAVPPEMAGRLDVVAKVFTSAPLELDRVLWRVRQTAEGILFQLCETRRVTPPDHRTIGPMLDSLRRVDALPEDVLRAIETIGKHTNPGAHWSGDPLASQATSRAATAAPAALLEQTVGPSDVDISIAALLQVLRRTLCSDEAPAEVQAPVSSPAPEATAAPEQQTRLCTVLYVNIARIAPYDDDPEPEETERLLSAQLQLARRQLEPTGAELRETFGNRIVALFGLRGVDEHDARRGVEAALSLSALRAGTALRGGTAAVATRVGVATGHVRIRERAVNGSVFDLAEDLARAAGPGAVLLASSTFHQAGVRGWFNVEPVSFQPRDAVKQSIAYRVAGRIALRRTLAVPDFHGAATTLVGRTPDLRHLEALLEETVRSRCASFVTLHGRAGVGRSRLLAEFYETLASHRPEQLFIVLQARCVPVGAVDNVSLDSYGLVRSLLRSRFHLEETDPAEVVFRKLRAGLRWMWLRHSRDRAGGAPPAPQGTEPEELVESLRQLTSLLVGSTAHDTLRPDDEGDTRRKRLVTALERIVRYASADLPLVVLGDDVHHADAASRELLSELVRRCPDVPLFVLCTARSGPKDAPPPWAEGGEHHRPVELRPLWKPQIEEMARNHLRHVPDLPDDLVDRIAVRAAGKPLYVVAILELLVDRQVLSPRPDAPWSLQQDRLQKVEMPAAIEAVEQARLTSLVAEERRILTHAAVVGREVWIGAVLAVDHVLGQRQSSAAVTATLESLAARRFLVRQPASTFPGELQLNFAEPAMQEVAYGTLSQDRRKLAHRAVAEWLRDQQRSGDHAASIAHHLDLAGDTWQAAEQWCLAAERSASLGDNEAALQMLLRARALHERGGEDVHPTRGWLDRARVLLALGKVQRKIQAQVSSAEATFLQALAVVDAVGRPSKRDAKAIQIWRARVEHGLAELYKVRGDHPRSLAHVKRSIEGAERAAAFREALASRALEVFLYRRNAQPEAARDAAARALSLVRSVRREERAKALASGTLVKEALDRWAQAFAHIFFAVAIAHITKGQFARAERTYARAARDLSEREHPQDLAIALNGIAGARVRQGNLDGASEMFERSLRLKQRLGDPHQIAVAHNNLSEAKRCQKSIHDALRHACEAVRLGKLAGAWGDLADMHRNLAESLFEKGDLEVAIDEIQRADELAKGPGHANRGEVWISLARIARAAADREDLDERRRAWAASTIQRLCEETEKEDKVREAGQVRELLGCP